MRNILIPKLFGLPKNFRFSSFAPPTSVHLYCLSGLVTFALVKVDDYHYRLIQIFRVRMAKISPVVRIEGIKTVTTVSMKK